MINIFEYFGIDGVDMSNTDTNQSVRCPRTECRSRNKNYTPSLSVHVGRGVWNCHHCGWAGSVDDNYAKMTDYSNKLYNATEITQESDLYWDLKKRKITLPTINKLGIKQIVYWWKVKDEDFNTEYNEQFNSIIFPNYFREKVVNAKIKKYPEKRFQQFKNGYKLFYNLNSIADANSVVIVEGEFDVAAALEAGIENCISVPDGAPDPKTKSYPTKFKFLDNSLPYLKHIDKFIIAVDNDAPGLRLREELVRRLGKDKCYYVTYPDDVKDLNDVLIKYSAEKIVEIINNAKPFQLDHVYQSSALIATLLNVYDNGYGETIDLNIGRFDDYIKKRKQMMYIYTGIPSHGKSTFKDFEVVKGMLRGEKYLTYAPESKKEAQIIRLLEQLTGKSYFQSLNPNGRLTKAEIIEGCKFLDEHIFFMRGDYKNLNIKEISKKVEVYTEKFGINEIIIDPFNTLDYDKKDYGGDDIKYIGDTLDEFRYLLEKNDIIGSIIAHPTKMETYQTGDLKGEYYKPKLYNISGSSHWKNKADVGIIIYKQKVTTYGGTAFSFETIVNVEKVKDKTLGTMGEFTLWFDKYSERYYDKYDQEFKDKNYLQELLTNGRIY